MSLDAHISTGSDSEHRSASPVPVLLRAVFCEGVPRLFRLPTATGAIIVRPGQTTHPIVGPIDEICNDALEPLTRVGQVSWRRPDRIPPVLEPSVIPAGAGTGLLNVLATRATGPLRYRGPYPTAALYHSLSTCFRPSAGVEIFTEGVEAIALAGRVVEPPVWFEPDPFVRLRSGRVVVEVRGEPPRVEAIYVDGQRFVRSVRAGRCVQDTSGGPTAVFAVPGHPPIEVVSVDASGVVTSPITSIRPLAGRHLGQPLPAAVAAAVFATAAASAPAMLRPAIAALEPRGIRWADTGLSLASGLDGRLAVHGGLATGDLDGPERLMALVEAAVPVVLRLAQAELSE